MTFERNDALEILSWIRDYVLEIKRLKKAMWVDFLLAILLFCDICVSIIMAMSGTAHIGIYVGMFIALAIALPFTIMGYRNNMDTYIMTIIALSDAMVIYEEFVDIAPSEIVEQAFDKQLIDDAYDILERYQP